MIADGPRQAVDRLSRLQLRSPDDDGFFRYAIASDRSLYLRWGELFDFAVSPDGRTVAARPLRAGSAEAFETYLLSQVLSCSLLRLGVEPIHATVVDVAGRAIGIVADPGYGKSTLTASFLASGHRLVTDDLMVVSKRNGRSVVEPGPRRIKLFPGPAHRFLPARRGTPINDRTEKAVFLLDGTYAVDDAVPLAALYVMRAPAQDSVRSRVTIRRMAARSAFIELTKASFNSILVEPDRLRNQFACVRSLVGQVPVKSLSFPAGLGELERVRDAIVRDVDR